MAMITGGWDFWVHGFRFSLLEGQDSQVQRFRFSPGMSAPQVQDTPAGRTGFSDPQVQDIPAGKMGFSDPQVQVLTRTFTVSDP